MVYKTTKQQLAPVSNRLPTFPTHTVVGEPINELHAREHFHRDFRGDVQISYDFRPAFVHVLFAKRLACLRDVRVQVSWVRKVDFCDEARAAPFEEG